MANIKITDLSAIADPISTDVLPIVDVSADTTNKISIEDLLKNAAAGTAGAPAFAFDGDSDTGIYRPGANQVAISTNGTGRLFIDASGNVSIGSNSSISAAFTVVSQANAEAINVRGRSADNIGEINFWSNNEATRYAKLSARSTYVELRGPDSGSIQFNKFDGTQFAIIDSSGRLGLGTSSPNQKLHVYDSGDVRIKASSGSGNDVELYAAYGDVRALRWNKNGSAGGFRFQDDGAAAVRMFIDSSGNVGIGTTSPDALLDVENSSGASEIQIKSLNASDCTLAFGDNADTDVGRIRYAHSADAMLFFTAANERVRINSSGNVGIGTSSPAKTLDVNGTSYFRNSVDLYNPTGGAVASTQLTFGSAALPSAARIFAQTETGTAGSLYLQSAQSGTGTMTTRMILTSEGRVGVGTTSPTAIVQVGNTAGKIFTIDQATSNETKLQNDRKLTLISGSGYGTNIVGGGSAGYGHISFETSTNGEKVRIDSSGRLLVGTSSLTAHVSAAFKGNSFSSNTNASIYLMSDFTNPAAGQGVGTIKYADGNENVLATIDGISDGTWGTNDYPGRLVFSTTADGASSPTERMRIDSSGRVGVGTTSPGYALDVTGSINAYNGFLRIAGTSSPSGNDPHLYRPGTSEMGFWAGGSERMRIDSSGRLLVGTSSARQTGTGFTAQSQVEGAATVSASSFTITSNRSVDDLGPRLNFARSKGGSVGSNTIVDVDAEYGGIYFFGADGTDTDSIGAQISAYVDGTPGANDMPGRLVFSTTADGASSPTERMRITNGGLTRLVTSNHVFEITSAASAGTTYYLIDGRAGGTVGSVGSGTTTFRVYTNGNVVNTNNSYGAISDAKLKENIVDASSQWDDIKDLRVRKYNFIEGQTHTQIGVVAQEVETVSPGLVSESPDRDEEGNDLGTTTKSVNYSVLYMKAVKALQEAMERIETLEAKVAALETP